MPKARRRASGRKQSRGKLAGVFGYEIKVVVCCELSWEFRSARVAVFFLSWFMYLNVRYVSGFRHRGEARDREEIMQSCRSVRL